MYWRGLSGGEWQYSLRLLHCWRSTLIGTIVVSILVVLGALVMSASYSYTTRRALSVYIERASRGDPYGAETGQEQKPLKPELAPAAESYVRTHPNFTSYHLLRALHDHYPESYAHLPAATRAAVLCSALARVSDLNDWGTLDEPGAAYDSFSAKVLLKVGTEALPYLRLLLDDQNPAWVGGSEAAMASQMDQWRRADFAYRYASLILGCTPKFDPDPKKRDLEIERLKARLDELLTEVYGGRLR